MYKHLVIIIGLSSLCCFLYGILTILLDMEKNSCQMTYMFQLPTFIKVQTDGAEEFPKYNLYAYAEGRLIENARSQKFNGAPVIFVPGNRGSYKQGRALASVALRKGIDNDQGHHLDYFLVDFNEEFSGLFGVYLINQKKFLEKCIRTVLNLYKNLPNAPTQVILIGHSMGGVVVQSMLTNLDIAEMINTVIFMSAPVDRPVINIDVYLEAVYRDTNAFLQKERTVAVFQNDTNYCSAPFGTGQLTAAEEPKKLDDKLLISIGGGNRDLLVHTGLTYSKFSDISVMASAIPNVWLSTDHLASVWCRQLVLVINRFLFSIISSSGNRRDGALSFVQDKPMRLAKANYYFVKGNYKKRDVQLESNDRSDEWFQDSRRVFSKEFTDGVNHTFFQMIPLIAEKRMYKKLYAEAVNLDSEDWIFGCDAKEFKQNMRYCSIGYSISHHVEKLPSNSHKRMIVSIDLHKIKNTYPSWTHVVLRILPTRNNVKLNVDIHDPDERTLKIRAPRWFSYTQKELIADTALGASHYKILVSDLDESHQAVNFYIIPRVCSKPSHHAITKSCVPWAKGFQRYQNFSETETRPLSLSVPISKPLGYNTTDNPVVVNLYLDPYCRYQITYHNSFGSTVSRIVQQYVHWLPAHLTAILFLSFKYQLSVTPTRVAFKCGKLHSAIVHCGSFFIITVTRIFSKIMQSFKFLPEPDNFHHSLLISFLIHGSASAIILLSTGAIWTCVIFYGHVIHKIFLKLTNLSSPVFSIALPIIERFPLVAGAVLISIAFASCGGVALILGCFIYFMLISKQYEDYLEQFVFKTMAIIAKKLFGKKVDEPEEKEKNHHEDNLGEADHRKETQDPTAADDKPKEDNKVESEPEENKALLPDDKEQKEEAQTSAVENIGDVNSVRQDTDAELERLLNEAIDKQNEILKEKEAQRKLERKEYDAIPAGLTPVHFHMTLLLLLCMLTILFIPTTVSWATDFRYSNSLSPDPSIIPATIALSCVFILWHISAPRNLYAYNFVASILYVCASICVVYCQDSVYRLCGVIPAVFGLVTAHQIFTATKEEVEDRDPSELELLNRIEKMKAVLNDADNNSKKTS